MKKNIGYLVIIIIGVLAILSLFVRSNTIDNNISKENNTVELFAKN